MIYVVNELLDMLQYLCFLYIFFKEQLMFSVKRIGMISGAYLLCFMAMVLQHQEQNLIVVSTITQIILIILILGEKWYEKMLSFCLLFSLPGILVLSIEIIGRYFIGQRNLAGMLTDDYEIVGRLLTLLIASGCVFLRRRSSKAIYVSNSSKAILSGVSMLFMFLLAWMTRRGATVDDITGLLVGLTSLAIVMVAVWVLIIDSSREKLEIKGELAKQYLGYIGQLEENQNEIRRMNHDFHKHINALSLLNGNNEYEKLGEYLQTMGIDLNNRFEDVGYTENTLFNALISDKIHRAREKGIAITHKGTLEKNITISDYDLCAVVSNLIDNAMEYVEDHEEKNIAIITNQDQNSILFSVTNPVAIGQIIDTGKTSKANKEIHGFGLRNVRHIVQKYRGELMLSQKKNFFTASVIIYY